MGTLINGIKEIFASASQTSPTNIPTCAADGTPNGNITIANLASVLGVFKYKPINDVNELKGENCWVSANNANNITNMPFHNGHAYAVFNFRTSSADKQLAFDLEGGEYWVRYDNNSWVIGVPSFYKDYSTLASLASALGVQMISVGGGLENISINGVTHQYGIRFSIGNSSTYYTLHVCVCLDDNPVGIYVATQNNPSEVFDPNTATWHKLQYVS